MDERIRLDLPENAARPTIARNKQEFVKLLLVMNLGIATQTLDGEQFTSFLKYILHDYLALVLNGDMEPFEAEHATEPLADLMMDYVNQVLQLAKIPLKENDKGEIELDLEQIGKMVKEYGKSH